MTIGILQSQADPEAKLFAATTLRGKVRAYWTSQNSLSNLLDYLRCQPNPSHGPPIPPRSAPRAFESFCNWPATHQNPIMCLSGNPSDPDD
jgi:hypothetical protein